MRVYERPTGAEKCRTGTCLMYGLLPAKRHVVGKGGEVNRSEGLHSCLRDRLKRLRRRAKGKQECGSAKRPHSPGLA